jgi:hypothetical protein
LTVPPRRLRLELSPSPGLAVVILAVHAAGGLCVLAVLPSAAGGLLAAALLGLGTAAVWSRALHRSGASVRSIELDGPQVILHLEGGESFVAETAQRRYVSRFLVALPVRRPVRRTIVVTRDMLDGNLFRALRIWALWGRLPAVMAAKRPPA